MSWIVQARHQRPISIRNLDKNLLQTLHLRTFHKFTAPAPVDLTTQTPYSDSLTEPLEKSAASG